MIVHSYLSYNPFFSYSTAPEIHIIHAFEVMVMIPMDKMFAEVKFAIFQNVTVFSIRTFIPYLDMVRLVLHIIENIILFIELFPLLLFY